MQEGESELGGLQIPHGNTTPSSSTSGPQPEVSDDFSPSSDSQILPSEPPVPAPQPTPEPPVTPPVASTPAPSVAPPPVNTPVSPITPPLNEPNLPPQPINTSPVPPSSDFTNQFSTPNFSQPQPLAPTTPPPQPFQTIYPTSVPTPPANQPIFPFSDSEATLPASPASKSKKGLIIFLAIAVILIGGFVALYFGTDIFKNTGQNGNTPSGEVLSSKNEVYDALWEFDFFNYSDLIYYYDQYIGLKPDLKMSEYTIIFPLSTNFIQLTETLQTTTEAYDNISKTIPDTLKADGSEIDLKSVKDNINQSLQAIKKNLDTIQPFYDAYYVTLFNESRPTTCSKTDAMLALENGSTKPVAEKYYALYCESIDILNQTDDYLILQQKTEAQATEAASLLNSLLIEVPSATDSLNKAFEELIQ